MALIVTSEALEELNGILDMKSLPLDKYLKLAVPPEWSGPGDFGIVIDVEKGGELKFEYEDNTVLLVDLGLAENLESSVFDFKDNLDGKGFTLDVY